MVPRVRPAAESTVYKLHQDRVTKRTSSTAKPARKALARARDWKVTHHRTSSEPSGGLLTKRLCTCRFRICSSSNHCVEVKLQIMPKKHQGGTFIGTWTLAQTRILSFDCFKWRSPGVTHRGAAFAGLNPHQQRLFDAV